MKVCLSPTLRKLYRHWSVCRFDYALNVSGSSARAGPRSGSPCQWIWCHQRAEIYFQKEILMFPFVTVTSCFLSAVLARPWAPPPCQHGGCRDIGFLVVMFLGCLHTPRGEMQFLAEFMCLVHKSLAAGQNVFSGGCLYTGLGLSIASAFLNPDSRCQRSHCLPGGIWNQLSDFS